MSDWKAATARITLFSAVQAAAAPSAPSAMQLYKLVWRDDPENFQRQPNPLVSSIAQGNYGNMAVSCSTQPSRVDLTIAPPPQRPASSVDDMSVPLFRSATEVYQELERIIEILAGDGAGPMARVALSLQFLNLTRDYVEANKALMNVIPRHYGISVSDEEDVIFQVNRPYTTREVEAGNVPMNAVRRWSVHQIRMMILTVAAPGAAVSAASASSAPSQTKTYFAADVTLDINSRPIDLSLSGHRQSLLLREALSNAQQIQQSIYLSV